MEVKIRLFATSDYPGVVAVTNAATPDYPVAVDELRYWDLHRDPKCFHARFVAERAGKVVGHASGGQWTDMFDPRKFGVEVTVHPTYQGQGIGSRLYDRVLDELRPRRPLALRAGGVREDMVRAREFLAKRGFREEMRFWESRLDLRSFDPAPYQDLDEQVRAKGIQIRTLAELRGEAGWERRLFDLVQEVEADVPQPEPYTPPAFEWWIDHRMQSPGLLPEGWFIAVDGDAYVGESNLWKSQAGSHLDVGLTGVRRAYRRRGIALALKIRAIAWAQAHGYSTMRTTNERNNHPMLAINERLGFVKQPAWIGYVKELPDEPDRAADPT